MGGSKRGGRVGLGDGRVLRLYFYLPLSLVRWRSEGDLGFIDKVSHVFPRFDHEEAELPQPVIFDPTGLEH